MSEYTELSGVPAGDDTSGTVDKMRKHEWRIKRFPQTAADWMTEIELMDEAYKAMALYKAGESEVKFQLGRRPESPEDVEAESKLRDTERRWEVELQDRNHRADLAFRRDTLLRRAESIRGWALVAVVVAVVISPWVAMAANVAAEDFSMYMVPVTGIAGTIIGYWFGQGGSSTAASREGIMASDVSNNGRV
ncbi:hypothetical protein ABT404_19880 [Streptomyces hyaluromycini]|uniref:Integral membrane protein n=1 Tax=Streptomyces hyaluromycini TaxID=1377993 RepID=A0ABV1WY98_9ACTN